MKGNIQKKHISAILSSRHGLDVFVQNLAEIYLKRQIQVLQHFYMDAHSEIYF